MAVTVKVNGTSNSLIHKGGMHFAKSTAPDVCKTPSPAGPVPIPYPIIVSMSSDLAKGTTTVKADGKMAAVKDCEFSMCTGDEPGTAGGVVSSTFKKEAKFILFSFDVKLDGKNACRLSDKMTMNHQNTICMQGVGGPPVVVVPVELTTDCGEKKQEKGWDKCDNAQVCQMVKAYNSSQQKKFKPKVSPSHKATPKQIPNAAERARQHLANKKYTNAISAHKRDFAALVAAKKKANPSGYMDDPKIKKMFNTDCEHARWKKGRPNDRPPGDPPGCAEPSGGKPFGINPDHQHPCGAGGKPDGALKWANAEVNQTVGPAMDKDPAPKKFKAHESCNCP